MKMRSEIICLRDFSLSKYAPYQHDVTSLILNVYLLIRETQARFYEDEFTVFAPRCDVP